MHRAKVKTFFAVLLSLSLICDVRAEKVPGVQASPRQVAFTENKGQVCDQNYRPRPDVLFGGTAGDMVFHLRRDGISYQLSKIHTWTVDTFAENSKFVRKGKTGKYPEKISAYRIDVNWLNCNENVKVETDRLLPGYANYYNEVCPDGVHDVKTYGEIHYKNIYNGIDVRYFDNSGALKYDFIVSPGSDYRQIKIQISGAVKIGLLENGAVGIETPFGDIVEEPPLVLQHGTPLKARWKITGNILSFDIDWYDPADLFVIDPVVRSWSTYYGDVNSAELLYDCATDAQGNVIACGSLSQMVTTGTVIATSGAHQTTYQGIRDAFLVKFDGAGVRQWGTYYGGAGMEDATSCAIDTGGNIYMAGVTESTAGISSPGSHQVLFGGNNHNDFLVKFNNAGIRQWSTYYSEHHASAISQPPAVCTNTLGDVFLAGNVSLLTNTSMPPGTTIATPGTHLSVFSGIHPHGYLVKFNSNGIRQWGTFYGGVYIPVEVHGCAADNLGNVYMLGEASIGVSGNGTAIATPGSHQPTVGTGATFLAKFNSVGVRQWGTFYGERTWGNDIAIDSSSNVFIVGTTEAASGTLVATPGAYQTAIYPSTLYPTSSRDAFVAKFNSNGVRLWGTYYGDQYMDNGESCAIDLHGNVVMCGYTTGPLNSTVLASPGAHQVSSFGFDAYLVKFSSGGARLWGTYYGTILNQRGFGVSTYSNATYMCGNDAESQGGAAFGTPGSHQPQSAGNDAFLVKFMDCTLPPSPTNITPPGDQIICSGNAVTLQVAGTGTIQWYSTPASDSVLYSGSTFTINSLSVGTHTFYAQDFVCGPSINRTAITITVNPTPTISIPNGSICSGDSFTLNPTGASTYTYSGGSSVVSPSATTSYSVAGTNSAGCTSTNVAVATVTVYPLPVISANSGTICSGESFTIIPSGATIYTVSGGSFVVGPLQTTGYTITGTSPEGCESATPAIATVSVLAAPSITVAGGAICAGESFTLLPAGAVSYSYSSGGNIVSPLSTTNYSVSGTNAEGCTSATPAIVTVTVHPPPSITISGQNSLCTGQSAILSVSGVSSFTWNNGSMAPVLFIQPASTATYQVNGQSPEGCTGSAVYTVAVKPAHVPTLNNVTTCAGVAATLQPQNPHPLVTYSWLPVSPPGSVLVVSPSATSTYTLQSDLDGCITHTTATVTVTEKTQPNILFNYAGPVCAGQAGLSQPVPDPAFTQGGNFIVSPPVQIDEITGTLDLSGVQPGTYVISYLLGAKGCTLGATHSVNLVVAPSAPLQLNAAKVRVEQGASVTLMASGAAGYSWTPAEGLSCSSCASPVASPAKTTTFCVTDPANACALPACVEVIVDDLSCAAGKLTTPNAFTPNNDGTNDFLVFDGWQRCVSNFHILIFDRWGEKVFESSDPAFRWDGSYKGKPLESDVLVYVLRATLGEGDKTERKGNITLIR